MSQFDYRQRFLFPHSDIRGEIVQLQYSVQAALQHRHYPLAVQSLLAESMVATLLLAATVKLEGKVILQAQGSGAVSLMVAEATHDSSTRATAQFDAEHPQATGATSLNALLGDNGLMAVTLRPDEGQQYQGMVPMEQPSLSGCLEDYLERSEQIPSRVLLVAGDGKAAGLLLQRLPQRIASAEQNDEHWQHLTTLLSTLTHEELLSLPAEAILHRLFHETPPQVTEPSPVRFQCTCSRERVSGMLLSLGREELQSLLDEQGQAAVNCDFCGHTETFDAVDLDQLVHQL